LIDAKEVDDFVLTELVLKRGHACADMGNTSTNIRFEPSPSTIGRSGNDKYRQSVG
jgi:hypothetical protein